jgi:leucyl aminopeptidase
VRVEATTESPLDTSADTIVVGLVEGKGVAHDVAGNPLGALLEAGEARTTFRHLAVTHAEGRRFILVGLGSREALDAERARIAAAVAHGRARELGAATLCWEVPHHVEDPVVEGLVEGTLLHAYRFDRYRRLADEEDGEDQARGPERLILSAHHDVSDAALAGSVLATAQNRARDLANTPANDLTPAALAEYAMGLAERIEGLSVNVLDEDQIRDAGMGAFAAVAQGSAQSARLISIEYDGAGAESPRIALVGKAVTFDSGGISLKPAAKMYEMKFDMCGGAAVIEAIAALAELRAPVRAIAVIGATENMPSGRAVRPGDIVTALDGTTIEINNTDAEGRLVLADCISYARQLGCERIVDVATLTGGIVVALGSLYAGLFANDDAWAAELERCGERTGELLWRMPLHREYAKMIRGRYARLTNRTEVREASSITAAELLHHFAGDVPWAHLDIAGVAWDLRRPYLNKGGSGFGVRTLVRAALAPGP